MDVYGGFKWCNNETHELKGNILLISGDKDKQQDLIVICAYIAFQICYGKRCKSAVSRAQLRIGPSQ